MGKFRSAYTGAQIELAIAKARGLDDLTVSGGVLYVDGEELVVSNDTFAVVDDITTRDALDSSYLTAFVVDATDDVTVDSGSATYVLVNSAWVKSSETESLDIEDLSDSLDTVSGDLDSLELEFIDLAPFIGSFTSSNSTGFAWTDNVLTITHGLNNLNISITIRDNNGEEVSLANDVIDENNISVYFPVANVPISDTWTTSISSSGDSDTIIGDGMNPLGTYVSDTTYILNDGVTYDGSYYRSKVNDNIGNQPNTSLTQWELTVSKGEIGEQGIQGIQGIQGETGEQGIQGETGADGTGDVAPFTGSFTSADSTGFVWADNVLTITHSLNSSNVSISIRDNNGEAISLANDAIDANNISVYFPVANVPITGTYTTLIKK